MLTLEQAARELDLEDGYAFINYLIESKANGNISQCKELFLELSPYWQLQTVEKLLNDEYFNAREDAMFYLKVMKDEKE